MEAAGIIGLGIMGGAMARNLRARAGACSATTPTKRAPPPWPTPASRRSDSAEAVARAAPMMITSLPNAAALHATAAAIAGAGVERRVVVEASTLTLDDKLAFEATLRQAGHAALDCPISGTGAQAKTKDLVVYASGDGAAIAQAAPLSTASPGPARPRRLRQRQPHEIRRQPAGRDPQRRHGRGDGARHEGGARPADGRRDGRRRRRQLARVRAPRADDGAERLRRTATMKVSIWQKDMAIIGEFAARARRADAAASAPRCRSTTSAMATGHAEHDTAAVCTVLEAMAGIPRV